MQRRLRASLLWTATQVKKSGAMVQSPHLLSPAVADVEGAVAVEVHLPQMPRLRVHRNKMEPADKANQRVALALCRPRPVERRQQARRRLRQELEVVLQVAERRHLAVWLIGQAMRRIPPGSSRWLGGDSSHSTPVTAVRIPPSGKRALPIQA